MTRVIISIFFILTFVLYSCSKITPSGFWMKFQKGFLKEHISDHGPYGGHLAIHWKSKDEKTFNSKAVNDFATEHGWELVDSLEVQANDLIAWNYNGRPIFPLSYSGFSSDPPNDSTHEKFPRWINMASSVYMFKTGWITVEPGTGKSNEVNGFVVLAHGGNEMEVYHLWGE